MPQIASDGFNRADSTQMGANWTSMGGSSFLAIVGNEVQMPGTGAIRLENYTGSTFPNDQYSECRLTAVGVGTSGGVGVTVRATTDYYAAGKYNQITDNSNRRIFKQAGGVRTGIATEAVDVASGDVIRLVASGSNIELFVNSSLSCAVVDSALTSGLAGIFIRNLAGTAATAHMLDDWAGGDFSSVGAAFFPFRLMMMGVR